MEAMAVSRYVRISARKARLVADLIRGRTIQEALDILALTPKKAVPLLRKTLLSAKANYQVKSDKGADLADTSLVIKEILVDQGPMLKRIRPRAQGRAYRIHKPMSHFKVTVGARD
ncbi:MAG: 50S ribosomal protein L22 [Candidatus Krumholzibacteria bacterium]|nr:50S ribosomal protein L22 [Candidatus Krumholzibacteria bacterium]